jgi:hypothetical protein
VGKVMNVRVPKDAGNVLTSFSGMVILHEVNRLGNHYLKAT